MNETLHRCRKSYTNRPLTGAERVFAEENHDLIYKFCKMRHLDVEEWYDLFAVAYVQSVKKYFEETKLQVHPFYSVLYNDLHRAYGNYFRDIYRLKRMPVGGFVNLDFEFEGDHFNEKNHIEEIWLDRRQQTEQEIIDKETLLEIIRQLHGMQQQLFILLLEGYKKMEIRQRLGINGQNFCEQLELLQKTVETYLMKNA